MKAQILIRLKEELDDAAGHAVKSKLHEMGFSEVEQVRIGKMVEMDIRSVDEVTAAKRVENMCNQLLANSQVEEFQVLGLEED